MTMQVITYVNGDGKLETSIITDEELAQRMMDGGFGIAPSVDVAKMVVSERNKQIDGYANPSTICPPDEGTAWDIVCGQDK